MKKQAIIFLDYNETFDDIAEGKGNVFIAALRRFVRHFDGNVKIAVITSALCNNNDLTIKEDLAFTLRYFPLQVREKFCCLIEENCKYMRDIKMDDGCAVFENFRVLSLANGTKKDGVERLLKHIDPKQEIDVCVFAGNSEKDDLIMIDANVGNRDKYFLLANRRVLKSEKYPVFKLSMQPEFKQFDFSHQIVEELGQSKDIIIKTTNNSYGVGKGLEVVTNILEKERDK